MYATVISVKSADKKHTLVKLELLVDGEKVAYTVSEGTYREIGCPLSTEEISYDALQAILREDGHRQALKKALRVLAFADNNTASLRRKLFAAGFTAEQTDFAVQECLNLGYIDENEQLRRIITRLAERELMGPHRIYKKLVHSGYRGADVKAVSDELVREGIINYADGRRRLIQKHAPKTPLDKKKLLYRYGYENEND